MTKLQDSLQFVEVYDINTHDKLRDGCTISCTTGQRRFDFERFSYDKRYPNHCTHCEGWGGQTYQYDPSPAGISLGSGFMNEFIPCEHCYDLGTCPRCGTARAFQWEDIDDLCTNLPACPVCGWSESYMDANGEVQHDPGKPNEFECSCWEIFADRYLDEIRELQEDPAWIEEDLRIRSKF